MKGLYSARHKPEVTTGIVLPVSDSQNNHGCLVRFNGVLGRGFSIIDAYSAYVNAYRDAIRASRRFF